MPSESQAQRQRRSRIKWVAVPIEDGDPREEENEIDDNSKAEKGENTRKPHSVARRTSNTSLSQGESEGEREKKHLKDRREALPSELFYDLFFVANLNVFTSAHEISTAQSLSSYIGFFALLWSVWFQTSMYDVRLGSDSVFDRCTKALQFGIMLGFAIVGSNFQLYEPSFYQDYGQTLSLILMASRFIMAANYFMASLLSRDLPHVSRPALLMSFSYVVTGSIYLGISFIFPRGGAAAVQASIAWYILAGAESLLNAVSHIFGSGLSFKDTHLVERMSLLTLIIIGEGVIGLLEAVVAAWNGGPHDGSFFTSFIEGVICGTMILFFLYQLYFDNRPDIHFGKAKARIWALLHFPLHLALLLCVEGSLHFVNWRVALSATSELLSQIYNTDIAARLLASLNGNPPFSGATNSTGYFDLQANFLQSLADQALTNYAAGVEDSTNSTIQDALNVIRDGARTSQNEVYIAVAQVLVQSIGTVFRAFDVDPPAQNTVESLNGLLDEYLSYFGLFDLVLFYFFIGSGCTLLLLGIMITISRGKHFREEGHRYGPVVSDKVNLVVGKGKRRSGHGQNHHTVSEPSSQQRLKSPTNDTNPKINHLDPTNTHESSFSNHHIHNPLSVAEKEWTLPNILRIFTFFFCGTGLALVALLGRDPGGAEEKFVQSYWVQPTVAITFFVVLFVQLMPWERWMGTGRTEWKRRRR